MLQPKEVLSNINYIKKNNVDTCIFGAGMRGTRGYEILRWFDVSVKFFCDNDPKKWGKMITNDICCLSPSQLQESNVKVVFILVRDEILGEIEDQVREMGIGNIITYIELYSAGMLEARSNTFYSGLFDFEESASKKKQRILLENSDKIFKVKKNDNKDIAIYTCIVGGYDEIHEPQIISDKCDYYLISDIRPPQLEVYEWIDVAEVVPDWVTDNRRRNRYCKINGNVIFSQYKYSIYIDGSLKIVRDITYYINKIGKSGIALPRLVNSLGLEHQCLYQEGFVCIISKWDDENLIRWQMNQYKKENMPSGYGLFECNVLVRENNNPICCSIMKSWWQEVFTKSYRDQLSFTYCLWKNGMTYQDVGCLGGNMRMCGDFEAFKHNK